MNNETLQMPTRKFLKIIATENITIGELDFSLSLKQYNAETHEWSASTTYLPKGRTFTHVFTLSNEDRTQPLQLHPYRPIDADDQSRYLQALFTSIEDAYRSIHGTIMDGYLDELYTAARQMVRGETITPSSHSIDMTLDELIRHITSRPVKHGDTDYHLSVHTVRDGHFMEWYARADEHTQTTTQLVINSPYVPLTRDAVIHRDEQIRFLAALLGQLEARLPADDAFNKQRHVRELMQQMADGINAKYNK